MRILSIVLPLLVVSAQFEASPVQAQSYPALTAFSSRYEVWVRNPEPTTKWFVEIEYADGSYRESGPYDSEFMALAREFGFWEYGSLGSGDRTNVVSREVPSPWQYISTFNNWFEAAELSQLFRTVGFESTVRTRKIARQVGDLSDSLQPWVGKQTSAQTRASR